MNTHTGVNKQKPTALSFILCLVKSIETKVHIINLRKQIEQDLEDPSDELHQMRLHLVDLVCNDESLLQPFANPESQWELVTRSWRHRDQAPMVALILVTMESHQPSCWRPISTRPPAYSKRITGSGLKNR